MSIKKYVDYILKDATPRDIINEARFDSMGNFHYKREPDARFGVYVDGKLYKAYWGKDAADRIANDIRKKYSPKPVEVKPID